MKMKTCTKCKRTLLSTTDFFYVHRNAWNSRCKQCVDKQSREYRAANKEKVARRKREYAQENKQSIAARMKIYNQKNKLTNVVKCVRRRARKHNLPDTFTEQEWIDCLEYFNHCCAVCGNQLRDLFGDTVPHADHWIPLASNECTGTIASNMVCLCNHCNWSKNAIMPQEWLSRHYTKKQAQQILERIETYFVKISTRKELPKNRLFNIQPYKANKDND